MVGLGGNFSKCNHVRSIVVCSGQGKGVRISYLDMSTTTLFE